MKRDANGAHEDKYAVKPRWLSLNPSKRAGEIFFLAYSVVWISFFGVIVATNVYMTFGNVEFMALGLAVALPCILYPLLFPSKADRNLPISKRYVVKANIWIALFNFVGNYFWTHYFFVLLGSSYSFPTTWLLNKIPIFLFLITQAYFCTYHAISNLLLRRLKTSMKPGLTRTIVMTVFILVFAYFIAMMEAVTISSVPFYSHKDVYRMYTIGSMFYALYFIISFPMFLRLDENPSDCWTPSQAAIDSLASAMIVFCLCDFWRLIVGAIVDNVNSDQVPFVAQ